MFVNEPAFSGMRGGRQEEDLGRDVLLRRSPLSISGELFQNAAVSISKRSRTTTHSAAAQRVALRCARWRIRRRVLARDDEAGHLAAAHGERGLKWLWSPVMRGR